MNNFKILIALFFVLSFYIDSFSQELKFPLGTWVSGDNYSADNFSSAYGPRNMGTQDYPGSNYDYDFHAAIDIAAPAGTYVFPISNSGTVTDYGNNWVEIWHNVEGNFCLVRYLHINVWPLFQNIGQIVLMDAPIGDVRDDHLDIRYTTDIEFDLPTWWNAKHPNEIIKGANEFSLVTLLDDQGNDISMNWLLYYINLLVDNNNTHNNPAGAKYFEIWARVTDDALNFNEILIYLEGYDDLGNRYNESDLLRGFDIFPNKIDYIDRINCGDQFNANDDVGHNSESVGIYPRMFSQNDEYHTVRFRWYINEEKWNAITSNIYLTIDAWDTDFDYMWANNLEFVTCIDCEPPTGSPPTPILNTAIYNSENAKIRLEWASGGAPEAVFYRVYRCLASEQMTNNDVIGITSQFDPQSGFFYEDDCKDLISGVEYKYAVAGVNSVGEGLNSNELSVLYSPTTEGTLTSNETWAGTINITGTVIVPSGVTLSIMPGTIIKLPSANITVQAGGKIEAIGTDASPITFTSADGDPQRSEWGTLFIYSSNNTFEHCIVEGSDWGIKMYGYPSTTSGNVVRNCIMRKNDQGLRIENTSATVEDCQIYDNRHGVVTINNQEVYFRDNHIHDNDRDGVYSTSGNYLEFYWNVIENNGLGHVSSTNGIYTRYNDYIWDVGYNTIRNNYGYEIYASYGNPYVDMWSSSIHDYSGYELYNYSGNTTLWAGYCWHGEYPPDYNQIYGDVYIYGPLSSQPSWEGSTSGGGLSKAIASDNQSSRESPVRSKARIQELQELISAKPATPEAEKAMKELYAIIRSDYVKNQFGEKYLYYDFLEDIYRNHENLGVGKKALKFMTLWKTLENNNAKAIELSQKALKMFSGPERMGVLENLIYLYLHTNQIANAEGALAGYKKKYAFDEIGIAFLEESTASVKIQIAKGLRPQSGIVKDSSPYEETAEELATSGSFTLLQNYPNPGNPTTTIQFYLPEASQIRLTIVNILGQEVKTLLNEQREAGKYTLVWDGKTDEGMDAPSGVYLYTLKTDDKVFTKKLLLLK